VDRYRQGNSPEAISRADPTFSLALINQVIAFYRDHQDEVDAYVAATRQEIDRQAAMPSPGPTIAELRRRRESMRGGGRTGA
jgi:hypothetical protein